MDAGRIARQSLKPGEHGIPRLSAKRRGGVVIKIDHEKQGI